MTLLMFYFFWELVDCRSELLFTYGTVSDDAIFHLLIFFLFFHRAMRWDRTDGDNMEEKSCLARQALSKLMHRPHFDRFNAHPKV